MRTKAVVYWLYDDRCICYFRHGYIGVTVSWPRRLWRHRAESSAFLPSDFEGKVLFRGHIKECLALEQQLRSTAGIGWNRYPGGRSGTASKGLPKSPEHKAKIRAAAFERWKDREARVAQSAAVKRGLKNVDRTGANNANFGKQTSEETKQKMRDRLAERGGVSGTNNPNYRHGRYVED